MTRKVMTISLSNSAAADLAIGETLRDVRRSCNVKQTELAHALGVTRATVTRWERGTRTISAATLLAIADLLQVPASLLLPDRHRATDPAHPPAHAATLPPDQAALHTIAQLLDQRPDLIATVVSLLETLIALDPSTESASDDHEPHAA